MKETKKDADSFPVARETAKFIHKQWPFIPEEEAYEFCQTLQGQQIQIAEIKIMLWTTKQVLEHKLNT